MADLAVGIKLQLTGQEQVKGALAGLQAAATSAATANGAVGASAQQASNAFQTLSGASKGAASAADQAADAALKMDKALAAIAGDATRAAQDNSALAKGLREAGAAASSTAKHFDDLKSSANGAENSVERLGKASQLTYQQQQIVQSAALNLFQTIAAGGSPMQAMITQGSQLVGAFGSINTAALLAAGGVAALAGGALAAGKAIATAGDAAQAAQDRLKGLVGSASTAGDMYQRLFDLSMRTGASIGDSVSQFARFKTATEELGASNDDVLKLVETIQKLAKIGGASTAEAANGAMQLAQGLGSGKLAGDELKSVIENMLPVAKAIADGLGVSVAKLKEMGEAGELTSRKIFDALLGKSDEANIKFNNLRITIDMAGSQAATAWSGFAAELDKSLGISNRVVSALQGVAAIGQRATKALQGPTASERVRDLREQSRTAPYITGKPFTNFGQAVTQEQYDQLQQSLDEQMERERALNRMKVWNSTPAPKAAPASNDSLGGGAGNDSLAGGSGHDSLGAPVFRPASLRSISTFRHSTVAPKSEIDVSGLQSWLKQQERALTTQNALNAALARGAVALETEKTHQEALATAVSLGVENDKSAVSAIEEKIAATKASAEAFDQAAKEQAAAAEQTSAEMEDLHDTAREVSRTIVSGFASMATSGRSFGSVLEEIGMKLASMAFDKMVMNPLEKGLSGLLDIGVKALFNTGGSSMGAGFTNNIYSGSGGSGSFFSGSSAGSLSGGSAFSASSAASLLHSGGMVGIDGALRYVHPAVFDGAPRMHRGGLAGDEVPAILQTGEMVLSRQQAARAMSGGSMSIQLNHDINVSGSTSGNEEDNMALRSEIAAGMKLLLAQETPKIVEKAAARARANYKSTGGWSGR